MAVIVSVSTKLYERNMNMNFERTWWKTPVCLLSFLSLWAVWLYAPLIGVIPYPFIVVLCCGLWVKNVNVSRSLCFTLLECKIHHSFLMKFLIFLSFLIIPLKLDLLKSDSHLLLVIVKRVQYLTKSLRDRLLVTICVEEWYLRQHHQFTKTD